MDKVKEHDLVTHLDWMMEHLLERHWEYLRARYLVTRLGLTREKHWVVLRERD